MSDLHINLVRVRCVHFLQCLDKYVAADIASVKKKICRSPRWLKHKINSARLKKFIGIRVLLFENQIKQIPVACRRHQELMSVVLVIFNVDSVSGASYKRQSSENIVACHI